MLESNNLDLIYGKQQLLKNITLTIPMGKFTAIIGPNGAGKSSLLRSLAGLEKSCYKQLRLNGKSFQYLSSTEKSSMISWVPERSDFPFEYTVFDFVMMGAFNQHQGVPSLKDCKEIELILSKFKLIKKKNRSIGSLSSGELRLLMMARAVAQKSRFILLDEPSANLDYEKSLHALSVLEEMKHNGVSICACMHDLSLVRRFADYVVVLKNGHLYTSGAIDSIFSESLIQSVFNFSYGMKNFDGRQWYSIEPIEQ